MKHSFKDFENSSKSIRDIIEVLKDSTNIMGENLLDYYTVLNPIAARYSQVYYSYLFRFCKYVEELARSINTLNFLSINTIARSAIECYAICKYIFYHLNDNIFSLMKTLVFTDLCEIKTTIDSYKKEVAEKPYLEFQIYLNQGIFYNILKDYFSNGFSWIAICDNNDQIIEYAKKEILAEKFDNSAVNKKTGRLMISNMVSKYLNINPYLYLIFNHSIEANTIYSLMCSSAHNNYNDVMNLFMISNRPFEFAVSTYPKREEISNIRFIIKMLYSCYVDLFFDANNIKYFMLLITRKLLDYKQD